MRDWVAPSSTVPMGSMATVGAVASGISATKKTANCSVSLAVALVPSAALVPVPLAVIVRRRVTEVLNETSGSV